MSITKQIAKHLREVYFGGNWTFSNYKDNLRDLSWHQAVAKVHSFNSIATLTFHTQYYLDVVIRVIKGEVVNAKDEYSFNLPPIHSHEDWEQLLQKVWDDAEQAVSLIEQLPDSILDEVFMNEKYGNYYRNLQGLIEHAHYHLGQIVLIKKILLQEPSN